MQAANCQVFALLVMVGVLMFLTSFLTLDFHTSIADLQKRTGHEFFHLPRGASVHAPLTGEQTNTKEPFIKVPSASNNKGVQFSNNYNGNHDAHEVLTLHEDELLKAIESNTAPEPAHTPTHPLSSSPATNSASASCTVQFKPTCRVNPLVRYWDEVMECYTSPLRKYHGLDAPLEDRKFVVFQPDTGGWNNIRMALEVVILFAQVLLCTQVLSKSAGCSVAIDMGCP